MKFALSIAVVVALTPGLALAAPRAAVPKDVSVQAAKEPSKQAAKPKDCSTIKSITIRQACLDREAAAHPAEQQQGNVGDAVDKLKQEDDLLAKKLKGICRGC